MDYTIEESLNLIGKEIAKRSDNIDYSRITVFIKKIKKEYYWCLGAKLNRDYLKILKENREVAIIKEYAGCLLLQGLEILVTQNEKALNESWNKFLNEGK